MNLEPNKLKDSEQLLRYQALKRKGGLAADKKRDLKFVFLVFGIIILFGVFLFMFPLLGMLLEKWL